VVVQKVSLREEYSFFHSLKLDSIMISTTPADVSMKILKEKLSSIK